MERRKGKEGRKKKQPMSGGRGAVGARAICALLCREHSGEWGRGLGSDVVSSDL